MAIHEFMIPTEIHGHVLCDGEPGSYDYLIVGFHGYTENAELQLQRLQELHIDNALLLSIQGLHCFYRHDRIAASWMTSQNRERCIADNIHYVNKSIEQLAPQYSWNKLVFMGFSQGAAMAYRAALKGMHQCDVLCINGGDIPPDTYELCPSLPPSCVLRGSDDQSYNQEKLNADKIYLQHEHTQIHEFAGGHEWNAQVTQLFSEFIVNPNH